MSINEDDRSRPGPDDPGAGEFVADGASRDVSRVRRGVAFGRQSENVVGLREDVTALIELERLERQIAAQRIEVLARVDRRALCEAGLDAHLGLPANPRDSMAHRAARAEIAAALHMSEQTIDRQLVRADTLTTQYAATVEMLSAGKISSLHATVILDAGEVIGKYGFEDTPEIAARRARYEERVLVHSVTVTANQLRPKARRIAEEYALTDLDTRHEVARARRNVWVRSVEDGMAELCAYLPAHEALAIYSRLTRIAQAVQTAEARTFREAQAASEHATGEVGSKPGADSAGTLVLPQRRARDEIRADLLTDFLLHGTGDTATGGPDTGISGIVQVVTHEMHLLETHEHEPADQTETETKKPARTQAQPEPDAKTLATATTRGGSQARSLRPPRPELEGYGPFPVSAARSIAGGGRNGQIVPWDIVTASPLSGDVLRVDRYRPSEAMRRFLAARDLQCRFPGCRTAAHRCEIDHTIDAALGGETSTANCGHLCVAHHRLKHHSGWDVKQHEYGVYEWTSPAGLTHIAEPASRVRFVEMAGSSPARHTTGDIGNAGNSRSSRPRGNRRQRTSEAQGTTPSGPGTSSRGALPDGNRTQPPDDLPETRF